MSADCEICGDAFRPRESERFCRDCLADADTTPRCGDCEEPFLPDELDEAGLCADCRPDEPEAEQEPVPPVPLADHAADLAAEVVSGLRYRRDGLGEYLADPAGREEFAADMAVRYAEEHDPAAWRAAFLAELTGRMSTWR